MNKLSLLFYVSLLLAALPVNAADRSGTVINLADYLSEAGKNADATSAVRRALTDCKKTKAAKLIIPEGTYHFYPDMATETYFFISNNDEGLKRIAFFLDGFSDFVIATTGTPIAATRSATIPAISGEPSMPILTASIPMSLMQASIWAAIRSGESTSAVATPSVFCAVIAVIAVIA